MGQGLGTADADRRRQWMIWGGLLVGLLTLLSVASGGFFLYAALVVLGLLGLSTLLVSLSVLNLHVERSLSTLEVPYGGTVDAHLTLHNRKPWLALWLFWRDEVEPGLDVEGAACAFESLHGDATAELRYRLHSTRRGFFRLGPAVVEANDPFGLVRRFHLGRRAEFITVLPRIVGIAQNWPLGQKPIHEVPKRQSLFEDPSRFLGVRAYRPGDPLKRIHWRAYARSGELQVKLFEPAVLDGALLALEMGQKAWPPPKDSDLGDPALELAVTVAASLAETVLAGGQKVGLLANGTDAAERYPDEFAGGTFRRLDDVLEETASRRRLRAPVPFEVEAAKGAWQQDRLRVALARLTPAEGPSLGAMLHTELPRLPRALVVLVVTPRLDRELTSTLAELRRSGFDVGVLWIGGGNLRGVALPAGIPVWPIRGDADLENLGAHGL